MTEDKILLLAIFNQITVTVWCHWLHYITRSTQPFTLRGTVKCKTVTHLYGLQKVVTLVQLTGAV